MTNDFIDLFWCERLMTLHANVQSKSYAWGKSMVTHFLVRFRFHYGTSNLPSITKSD